MNQLKHPARLSTFRLVALACALSASLVACGNKDGKVPATQVAAKVGSDEISIHQINQVLSRSNVQADSPQAVKNASREVLEKLIDQQLAINQAVDAKLDRTPETVAAIEAAKRDILARAYLQKLASAVSKPTADEAKKYYAEHPELFSARRIFNVQEVLVGVQPGLLAQLKGMAAAGKSVDEVTSMLKGKDIKYGGGTATRAAEQIPLEILPKVQALKDGQYLVLDTPQSITYLHLVASQSAPVDQAAALPRIEQFLNNQRATEAIAADIKRLRASTSIVYMGEFANNAPTAAAAPAQPPETGASETPADKARSAIEKGVAGLK